MSFAVCVCTPALAAQEAPCELNANASLVGDRIDVINNDAAATWTDIRLTIHGDEYYAPQGRSVPLIPFRAVPFGKQFGAATRLFGSSRPM